MKNKALKVLLSCFSILSIGAFLASCDNGEQNNNDNKGNENPPIDDKEPEEYESPVEPASSYTVRFDTDGGGNITPISVDKNTKAKAPSDPKKDGKVFAGWYLNDQLFSFDTPITSDITLKAKWEGTSVSLGSFIGNSTTNNATFIYRDSYFEGASNVFNKDLAMFMFGASVSNDGTDKSSTYFTDLGFEKATVYPKAKADYQGIYYTIAEKNITDYKLIVVSVRGVGYGAEWSGNFEVGNANNHTGFSNASEVVLNELKNYISSINYAGNYKIALTGYSRGGAVANVLADSILKMENKLTANENVYAYTFNTPKGLLKENAVAYDNVFNVINEIDIISLIAPEEYGFARCGRDINIYNDKIDDLIHAYNDKLQLPTFTASDTITDERELNKFILKSLIGYTYDPEYVLTTRDDYYNNYQDTLIYVCNLFFNLPSETLNKIVVDIMGKAKADVFSVITIIASGDSLYNYIKGFLDADNIQYVESDLLNASNKVVGFIQGPGTYLLAFAIEPNRSNLIRMIDMHFAVVDYVLLSNYSN